ncbi:hypothetical protein DH2020_046348 [Rehmannia glutinosa]|uniref:Uncharacterized protein n=1 Tax=Rehmannia glutinosa TaxID=99300 RepID=A0ABR0UBP1_REHGL
MTRGMPWGQDAPVGMEQGVSGVMPEILGMGSALLAIRLPPVNLNTEFANQSLQFTREHLGALIQGVVSSALARREVVERIERELPPPLEGRVLEERAIAGEGYMADKVSDLQKEMREMRNTMMEREPIKKGVPFKDIVMADDLLNGSICAVSITPLSFTGILRASNAGSSLPLYPNWLNNGSVNFLMPP